MIDAIFSVPLAIYDNILPNRRASYVVACEKEMQLKGSGHSFYCNIESTFHTNNQVHQLEIFDELRYTVSVFAQRFVKEVGATGQATLEHSWINIARSGHYQEHHHHIDQTTSFVGVYYAQANEQDKILLSRPFHNVSWMKGKGHYLRDEAEIHCREGRLIFFPSYLTHGFKAIERSVPKISIAFNFSLG